MTRRLIALDLPGGPEFVVALRRAWDDGDAVVAIDQRLPPVARRELLGSLRPSVVVGAGGDRINLADGVPTLDGDALVVATSGTTGVPKGVVHTVDSVRASAEATSDAVGVDPAADHWFNCLPVAHIGGLSVVTRALVTGAALTTTERFGLEAMRAAIAAGATLTSLVPTALAQVPPEGIGRLRVVLVGGSALPPDLPPNCVRTYGMTETGSGVVYDGLALPGVDLAVEDGEILVRGSMLLRAYRGSQSGDGVAEPTLTTPEGIDPRRFDGWFATGDAGLIADDGRLVVAGRIGDVIVTGGEKVWPETVERALAGMPGLADVAVGRRLDAKWGQRVVAFVVEDGSETVTLAAIRAWAKATVPAYAAPHEVVVVDRIARTAIGKIRRALLDPHR